MARRILFVCRENAGRSQMAEAFLRRIAPHLEAASAGTVPRSELDPTVVQAMMEDGIDMSRHSPKMLTDRMTEGSIVVNMGCTGQDSCPALMMQGAVEWNIEDPRGKEIAGVRRIRSQVRDHVMQLVERLDS